MRRPYIWKLGAICLIWFMALVVRADEHFVRLPGTCTNTELQSPFTNWDMAATNIQWAIDAAADEETVWVSNGTYWITNQICVSNKIVVWSVNSYSNTIVTPDWPTYTTRCFYVWRTGVVDGFTISNGHVYDSGGGGACIPYSASYRGGTIQNCYFVNNICGDATGGGGVYVMAYGIVSNCLFFTNYSSYSGGGIMMSGGGVQTLTRVLDCRVISNYAGRYGGGIEATDGGIISNCLIAGNSQLNASYSGGGIYNHGSAIGGKFIDCIISNNTAAGSGGGVKFARGLIITCTIVNNSAAYNGGGISQTISGTVSNSIITGNRASGNDGGGGIYAGGAGTFRNCLIRDNVAKYGGGLRRAANCILSCCTIVSNCATSSSEGGGGGIFDNTTGSAGSFDNCIIYLNESAGSSSNIAIDASVTSSFTNCCFAPELSGAATNYSTNNITAEPRFVNWQNGDYHLKGNSPCVNAGANQAWMTNSFDLDGRVRIRYGTVDMGAWEGICEGIIIKVW